MVRHKHFIGFWISTLFVLFLGTIAHAQTQKNHIVGRIYHDQNKNQQFDSEPILRGWFVKIIDIARQETRYVATDASGNYKAEVGIGQYAVVPLVPSLYWLPNQQSTILNFSDFGITTTLNLAMKAVFNCAAMQVDVQNVAALRRCEENLLTVRYANNGTQSAPNAYVDVRLPAQMRFKGATMQPAITENGQMLRFYVGDLEMNTNGEIYVKVQTDCDLPDGVATICYDAKISANSPCIASHNTSIVSAGNRVAASGNSKFGRNIIIEDEIIFRRFDPNSGNKGDKPVPVTNNTNTTETPENNAYSTRFWGAAPQIVTNPSQYHICRTSVIEGGNTGKSGKNMGISADKNYSFEYFTPNPMIETATILLPNDLSNTIVFELYDVAGRLQRREAVTGRQFTLQRQNLVAGLYIYRILDGKNRVNSGKIMVK
jgi:hypothetical protein